MVRRFRRTGVVAGLALLSATATAAEPCRGPLPASQPRFPDFGFLPAGYAGRVFKLSQDYPKAAPDPTKLPAFFGSEPAENYVEGYLRAGWKDYMKALRTYCFEGNIEADWRVEENPVRRWYHIPWQHYGSIGREGIRGMTKEAEVKKFQLAPDQTYVDGQTYAVAYYNDFAGATIGKVWNDHDHPDMRQAKFANGSIIRKLLFVDVPTEQVSSLVDPVLWQGSICDNFGSDNHSVRPVALIQLDVMVPDDRTRHRLADWDVPVQRHGQEQTPLSVSPD